MTPIDLLDVADTLRRHGRRVLLWALALAAVGYGVSYLIPATYRASAVILPPDEDELTTSLSLTRRGLSGLGRLGGPYFTQADIALAILRSRGVAEQIVKDAGLVAAYKAKDEEQAVDQLRDHTRVRIANDGTISVTVEDGSAARSAQLANLYLAELDRRNQRFRSSQARRTRQFLEHRASEADSILAHTERLAAAYQSQRGAVLITPEGQAAANAAATLMTQRVAAELELEQARRYASPNSEEVQRLQARVQQLSRQIGSLPAAQLGGAELLRDVAIQQQVLALLMSQLEEARIREAMDTPTIQILDSAEPPTKRAWPRRTWIAGFGFLVGAAIGAADLMRLKSLVRPAG